MDIDEIKQKAAAKIEEAFADTPMPRKRNYWRGPHECEDIEHYLGGKHWKEITPKLIWNIRECLSYLTPQAFRFYVPGYMLMVLLYPLEVDTLVDRIVHDLSPSSGYSFSDWHNRRLNKLARVVTHDEADGIVTFLDTYLQLSINEVNGYYASTDIFWKIPHQLEGAIKFWSSVRDGTEFEF